MGKYVQVGDMLKTELVNAALHKFCLLWVKQIKYVGDICSFLPFFLSFDSYLSYGIMRQLRL